jgi:hypothetical protein
MTTKPTPNAPQRARRALAYGMTSVLAVAAVLVLLAPGTLGAAPTAAVVLTAPYHGVLTGKSVATSIAGCSSARVTAAPFFDGRTGVGGFGDRASATSCPGNPLGGASDATSGFTSTVPIPIAHAKAQVLAVFTVVATGGAKVTAGTCSATNPSYSACDVTSESYLDGSVYVIDQTTGTYYSAPTYFPTVYDLAYSDSYCYAYNHTTTCSTYASNGSGALHVSTTFSMWFNMTHLNPSDSFVLWMSIGGGVSTYLASYGATLTGASAAAYLDAATGANGVQLDSVTIG